MSSCKILLYRIYYINTRRIIKMLWKILRNIYDTDMEISFFIIICS